MSFSLGSLVRPNILSLQPYSSARDEYSGSEGIFMDANENALGSVIGRSLNRYPDPNSLALRNVMARRKNLNVNNIFAANGSDQCISLLLQIFIEAGKDKILITPPTYGMYAVAASIQGAAVLEAPLGKDFDLELNSLRQQLCPQLKIIFLCSPNNPTANLLDKTKIKTLLKEFPGIVVVDEAYIDFCPEQSLLSELSNFPNLVVLQTLSKAWGLAGLRLGFAYASFEIVKLLMKVKAPYNLSSQTQETALLALQQQEKYGLMLEEIKSEREHLRSALEQLVCVDQVFHSDSNFLLVRFKNSQSIFSLLRQSKIIVRDRSNLAACQNCLRITVGSKNENQILLSVLKEVQA